MSHFSTIKTRLVNRECLVQALEDLKLKPQVYETPQPLTSYYGDSQGQSAEIIVPGYTFHARADMGFRWTGTEYEMIQDEYEIIRQFGSKFYATQLMPAYGKRMVLAKAEELRERFGECTVAETTNGQVQTLRLTFAGHQEIQQFARR
ncbi:DUF1257 domain-containing protein [Nostoc sp. FACHB-87]|uniref:DUF1257 domain-containing protein n=1 Tax=Nostocaceae TaxID=1162 RepID=UPI001684D5F4|nr:MULTISPECIES: DUF1257 domain-containing protein [Nostocaceae]MBD2458359.1 DUF1257 domain-containing protein [Nostoc sp. FACHB-87]MBD2479330.1 DUF1257 domain-containing protein [Anabaena sp. FACHB-83]